MSPLLPPQLLNLILSGGHTRPEPGVVQSSICDDPRACLLPHPSPFQQDSYGFGAADGDWGFSFTHGASE